MRRPRPSGEGLAADLSPDALEDETSSTTSSSSSSDDEPKLKIFQDSNFNPTTNSPTTTSHNNNAPSWYSQNGATPLATNAETRPTSPPASKCAKDIYNQGHSSHTTTSTTSASTAATTPSCSSTPTSASASVMAGGDHVMLSSQSDVEGLEKCQDELEAKYRSDSTDLENGYSRSSVDDAETEGCISDFSRQLSKESSANCCPALDSAGQHCSDDSLSAGSSHTGEIEFKTFKPPKQSEGLDFKTFKTSKTDETQKLSSPAKSLGTELKTFKPSPTETNKPEFRSPKTPTSGTQHDDANLKSDDDDDSYDDVSISQNVPNNPPISTTHVTTVSPSSPSPSGVSSSSSPLVGRRIIARGEEGGGASGSSSDSEGAARTKSARLHLDIQRPLTKYLGPYTLACDVTPSPMQESVSMASTLPHPSHHSSRTSISNGDASAATTSTPALTTPTSNGTTTIGGKVPRRPRKLPEIPRKHQGIASAGNVMERSIFDEIQEALIKEVSEEAGLDASSTAPDLEPSAQYPYILKHAGYLFDKKRLLIGYATKPSRDRSRTVSTSSVASAASEAGAAASLEEEISAARAQSTTASAGSTSAISGQRRRKNSDGDGPKRYNSAMATPYQDLEVTHRGMHRFIPRHADEVQIGIGDPIHVIKEYDDLWCEGVNLRTGERGIFPAMYANDLKFLEDSDGEGDEHWKFTMRYLGSVEVTSPSGDFALCQAINKVAQQGRIKTASLCILEINQYGIRMIDKSKEGHESQKFSNFFALKNISFCGTHPSNKRYFAFITKHPRENRFACHVFHSDRSTHRARDALGDAFKRFYQEYMAFTHPTEDIWLE